MEWARTVDVSWDTQSPFQPRVRLFYQRPGKGELLELGFCTGPTGACWGQLHTLAALQTQLTWMPEMSPCIEWFGILSRNLQMFTPWVFLDMGILTFGVEQFFLGFLGSVERGSLCLTLTTRHWRWPKLSSAMAEHLLGDGYSCPQLEDPAWVSNWSGSLHYGWIPGRTTYQKTK